MSVLGIKSSLKKLKKEAQPKKKKQRLWNKILGIMAKEKFDIAKKKFGTLSATQRSEVWALTVKEAQAKYKVISDARKVARNEQKERGALLRRQRAEARYTKERRQSKKEIFNIASQHHTEMIGTLKKEIDELKREIQIKPEKTVKPETQKTGVIRGEKPVKQEQKTSKKPATQVTGVKRLIPSTDSDDPRFMADTSTSSYTQSVKKQRLTTQSEGTK